MDSPQSSSDAQLCMDSVQNLAPDRCRAAASERPGGPTLPVGYERVVHIPEYAAQGAEPPQGSSGASRASRVLHFAQWTIAMVGVFALYLLLQVASATVGGVVLSAIGLTVDGPHPTVDNALFDNGIQVVMVVSQLIAVAIFGLWWRRIRPGSFGERREAAAPTGVSVAKTVASLLIVGFAAQFFVSGVLGLVELFFPETMAEYAELMEDSTVGVFALVAAVSTAILAPLNEEIVCRGVMLEYAMRAVSPGWEPRGRARSRAVSSRAFWIANMLQALAFGVLHMNIVQGSYAFAFGILEGWVFWRTGKLRYAMLLHFALNASSYLVEPLAPMINTLPTPVVFAIFGGLIAVGITMFERAWYGSDALPEVTAAEDGGESGALFDGDANLRVVPTADDATVQAAVNSTGSPEEDCPL